MNNFQFFNPSRIVFGKGEIQQLGDCDLKPLGDQGDFDLDNSHRVLEASR